MRLHPGIFPIEAAAAGSTLATVEVREVRPEEHEEAGRVTLDAYREFGVDDWGDYKDRIADIRGRADRTTVLVAVEDGRILGTATVELEDRVEGGHARQPLAPEEGHIRMLGVALDARGRGVGRALVTACIERARAAGKRRMTLHTTEAMHVAHRMYRSLGFERGPDAVWPDGFRLMAFELKLDAG
jgi:GNAT superfamily N-acetyltransferase